MLGPQALVASVPALGELAAIRASAFRQVPSASLGVRDILKLASEIEQHAADGADGIVVTQGTDTLEESAFLLDIVLNLEIPVVVTGAMRNPDTSGADGPANLLASVQVAASLQARGLGVLVVMGDEIHSARFVQKRHATKPAAFASPAVGPIGWITEGEPHIPLTPRTRTYASVPSKQVDIPNVALVVAALGDDGRLQRGVLDAGFDGVVVEAFGAGHLPSWYVEPFQNLAQSMPVVLTSRTGSGRLLATTYGFAGSETDLLARGLISGGDLDGRKARLLLTVLLMGGAGLASIREGYRKWISLNARIQARPVSALWWRP